MTIALYGLRVSRGIAIGKAYIMARDDIEVREYLIAVEAVEQEVARFSHALDVAREQLQRVKQQIPHNTPVDIRSFIDTHLLMLDDTALARVPIEIIRARHCNAEWALTLQRDALVTVFEQMEDAYLRTRRDDVDFVANRVLRILLNHSTHTDAAEGGKLKGAIVLADDISPADIVLMQHQGIAAFVTEYGGTNSHTAILARSLGIPAIVGVHAVRRYLKNGELIIVDGRAGVLMASVDEMAIDHYRSRQRLEGLRVKALNRLRDAPAITRDGRKVALYANVELVEDLAAIERYGAEGIGLYRTEMLYLNRVTPPSEEEQYAAYSEVIGAANGAPVTIRTVDIGSDKSTVWLHLTQGVVTNPALSLRGIRLCLHELPLFRSQLRAILRAAVHGQVRLMLPMLSNLQELTQVMQLVNEVKRELTAAGVDYNRQVQIGGMIEVPAAAMIADLFARHLDFLSIGTNDLIQYTLAADRIDDAVNYLYDPLHPGVLRLIQMTIDAGNKAGIPVAMCGEMAGDLRYTRLLLGMGLTNFSMPAAFILEVKRRINESDYGQLRNQVASALLSADATEIHALVDSLNEDE